ncbi:MAG: hypothetical protein DMH00_11780, partial [Acidobacteria bacterium]
MQIREALHLRLAQIELGTRLYLEEIADLIHLRRRESSVLEGPGVGIACCCGTERSVRQNVAVDLELLARTGKLEEFRERGWCEHCHRDGQLLVAELLHHMRDDLPLPQCFPLLGRE